MRRIRLVQRPESAMPNRRTSAGSGPSADVRRWSVELSWLGRAGDGRRRSGTTLSEILISILVMSIGVVSLVTLFPISVLRSIQASQLTNATIHRLNAEELIELFPRLVHDPDNNANLAEHEVSGGVDNPGNDGVDEGRFIVDPLGYTSPNLTPAVRDVFGNNAPAATAAIPARNGIRRYHGGFTTVTTAMFAALLGDTWSVAAKGTVVGSTADSIVVPPGADLDTAFQALTNSSPTNPAFVRLTLISTNGKYSAVRTLTNAAMITPATRTIDWSPLGQPFPAAMGTISRFRLEIYDARYSWLLTVRKFPNPTSPGHGNAGVDVVVFHKRAISETNEQVYQTTDGSGTLVPIAEDAGPLVANENRFTLNLSALPAGAPKPFLKKGGFVFDAQHAHWYRIAQVAKEETQFPIVTIDRPAVRTTHYVMAMPGVVEVFPIGAISYDPNNAP